MMFPHPVYAFKKRILLFYGLWYAVIRGLLKYKCGNFTQKQESLRFYVWLFLSHTFLFFGGNFLWD